MAGRVIGIDLGTTNSVVAVVDGPQPRVLDNREASSMTRSVVGLRTRAGAEPEMLVGQVALDNWPMAAADTIVSVKRLMGRAASDPEVEKVRRWALYKIVQPSDGTKDAVRVVIGGKEYSPVDVSALILEKLKADAGFRLGAPPTHAVITVPAYFSQIQRAATYKAGLKAGLKVVKVLDEPTAAAIAFGMDANDPTPRTLLVYDLGGGTFDISVIAMAGSIFSTLNLEGDMWLGGDNFDEVLVRHVLQHVYTTHGVDPSAARTPAERRFMAHLKAAAQRAKEQLSSSGSADIMVIGLLQSPAGELINVDITIRRDEFERMILPLVARYRACPCGRPNRASDEACTSCGASLPAPRDGRAIELVHKAMENASLTPDQIDFVLMAGNASTVPLVQESMEELFGREKVLRRVHPKHAVALGAALMAAWLGETIVCPACGEVGSEGASSCAGCGVSLQLDEGTSTAEAGADVRVGVGSLRQLSQAAPFHYGAQSAGDRFTVFVRKGDPYPTEDAHADVFHTGVPNQRMVSIPIFGGEDLEKASANAKQGEAFAVLPPELPKTTPVRIKLWLDANGVFQLSAHLDDGTDLKPWVVEGEKDARAIQMIEASYAKIGEKAEEMSEAEKKEAYARLEAVLDLLRARDDDGAIAKAGEIERWLEGTGGPEGPDERAGHLTAFADYLVQEYGWALSPDESRALSRRVADVRTALEGRPDLGRAAAALERLEDAVAGISPLIKFLLSLRGAILKNIRPSDPGRAQALLRTLEEAEDLLRRRDTRGLAKLEELAREVGPVDSPEGSGVQCPQCRTQVPAGVRFCGQCRYDTWITAHINPGGGRH